MNSPKVVTWLLSLAVLNTATIYLVVRDNSAIAAVALSDKRADFMPRTWECGKYEVADGAIVNVSKKARVQQGPTSDSPLVPNPYLEASGAPQYFDSLPGYRMQVQCREKDWLRVRLVLDQEYIDLTGWVPANTLSTADQRKSE